VTTSMRVAESVLENIRHIIEYAPNRDTVAQALGRNGLILVSESMCEAIEFINDFAPEHLEIIVENAREISGKINSAGLILVGGYTPVSLSDYCLGTNHVLPTRGFSHIHSSLSVFNFIRFVNVAECSRETLKRLWVNVKVLAKGEGLLNHALAVEERLKD
ncbi:MAG: histidinol dehydrogenase, partial [Candidatus Bathyarchaeia archaeon]